MAKFDPDKYLQKVESKTFDPDAYLTNKVEPVIEEPSMTESFVRGAAQGASFGFADELAGAVDALSKLAQEGGDLEDLKAEYTKGRDESRELYRKAEEANPITSTVGNFAGGFAVPVPGANALLQGAKGINKFGKLAGIGAAAGGLTSVGMSDKETAGELLDEAASGAKAGAVLTPALGMGVPAVASGLKNWWTGQQFGKDVTGAFRLSRENPDFMTTENAKNVADRMFATAEQKILPIVTDELQEAASKSYQQGISSAKGTTQKQELATLVDDAFSSNNPAVRNDPQFINEKKKMQGLVSAIADEQEIATAGPLSMLEQETQAAEKLKRTLAVANKKMETQLENDVRTEVNKLMSSAKDSNPKSAVVKAADDWFKVEEQKGLTAAYNQAVRSAEKETNAVMDEFLAMQRQALGEKGITGAELDSALDTMRKRVLPQLNERRDSRAKEYYDELLSYYKNEAQPLTRAVEEVNPAGEQIYKAEFIDPMGRKRTKVFNISKLESALAKNTPENTAAIADNIRQEKLAAMAEAPKPSITKEVDPATNVEMMVLRYMLPDGTEVSKPEIIKAALKSDIAKITLRPELTAEDLMKVKTRAQGLLDNYQSSTTKQGNPDIFDAARKLKDAVDVKLQQMGVPLEDMNKQYSTVSNVAGELGVDLRGVGVAEAPLRRRQAAEQIAKDFSTQYKDIGTNQERRIEKTRQILNESGLIDPAKVNAVFDEAQDLAYKDYLLRNAFNESYLATDAVKYGLGIGAFNARGKLLQASSFAGRTAGSIERGVKTSVGDAVGLVTRMSPEELSQLAAKVGDSKLANTLRQVATQPEGKRKALIFSMMQSPAYRESITNLIGIDDEE